jgi:hypothetical protein
VLGFSHSRTFRSLVEVTVKKRTPSPPASWTVVDSLAVSFPGRGSGSVPATLAAFVSVPTVIGRTVTVAVATLPAASVPSAHDTTRVGRS